MKKTTVLIADDHKIVRLGLAALIGMQEDLDLVGEASSGDDAVLMALRLKPDVVVMDIMMPGKDGVQATTELHERLPSAAILLLTSCSSSDAIVRALDAGACGALLKTSEDSILATAIRAVAAGKRYISPDVERLIAADPPLPELSERQAEVMQSLTRGLTNKDIAEQLGLCKGRVEELVKTVMTKLGAANRTEAVAIALRKHLLKI